MYTHLLYSRISSFFLYILKYMYKRTWHLYSIHIIVRVYYVKHCSNFKTNLKCGFGVFVLLKPLEMGLYNLYVKVHKNTTRIVETANIQDLRHSSLSQTTGFSLPQTTGFSLPLYNIIRSLGFTMNRLSSFSCHPGHWHVFKARSSWRNSSAKFRLLSM